MAVTELLLPRTSDAMTEAVLSTWLVPNGTEVAKGDLIAEVETDKAMVEVAAEVDGVLVAAVAEGATVEVGAVLAYLLDGDDIDAYRDGRLTLGAAPAAASSPTPPPSPATAPAPAATTTTDPADAAAAGLVAAAAHAPSMNGSGAAVQPTFASPLARRLAREHGLTLDDMGPGTGPNGRIVREDVLRAAQAAPAEREAQLSSRQKAMVTAMVGAKTEIPHFYLFRDIDLSAVFAYRRDLKAAGLPTPSVSTIAIKALGIVLDEHDFARRRWRDGRVIDSTDAHVGIAVADGIGEIVVPVVRTPAARSLDGIAGELLRLSDAVRSRSLRQEEMAGAVATISNLGMFGVDALLPIIPPSQSFIIGIGRDRSELFLDDLERVKARSVATFGFAGDHRVLTGVGGARILERLDQLLQHPLSLATSGSGSAGSEPNGSPKERGTRNE